jgi:hypothetical protein
MTDIPELFFKDADGVIEWHKTHYIKSYEDYLFIKEKIKSSKFSGSSALLRNLEGNKTVASFLSFLAEVNLANLFLDKSVKDLAYEPKAIQKVDFSFDDIALSIKNLHPKNYEKSEQAIIDSLREAGGGETSMTHKNFSNIAIKVEKTEMGTYGWERMETGHSGFLDSDLYEMSAPLNYIGEFENVETGKYKKVLFFFIQSSDFAQYYINDIVIWYFDYQVENYPPIFQNDMNWYLKLLKHPVKKKNIDALVFMYAPKTLLSWPSGCLGDVGRELRLQVYTLDKVLYSKLKLIFS